ncbi:MAG: hypothetical protein J0L82_00805 [Deltaproteobacteria bacterium]|nr:hypothetical protein [Deltaproteobacteria bacterium]
MRALLLHKKTLLFLLGVVAFVGSTAIAAEVRCEAYCLKTESHPIAVQGYSETVAWSKRYYADAKDPSSALEMLITSCKAIGGNKLLGDFKIGRSRMLPFNFLTQARTVNEVDCRPNIANGVGPNGDI